MTLGPKCCLNAEQECVHVAVCVGLIDRRHKVMKRRDISYLSKHLLLMQQEQSASRAFCPVLQHQGEVLDAFD